MNNQFVRVVAVLDQSSVVMCLPKYCGSLITLSILYEDCRKSLPHAMSQILDAVLKAPYNAPSKT